MKYDMCDQCGKTDYVGFVPCLSKNLCPDCAAEYFHADPVAARAEVMVKLAKQKKLEEIEDEINISYACRALLGGGKGMSVMQALLANNPGYFARIMAEAQKRMEKDGNISPV